MIVFTVTGMIAAAAAAIVGAGRIALAVRDRRRTRRRPVPRPGRVTPQPGEIKGPLRPALLARACGPCTGVRGAVTCICAGNCGHKRCRGAAVVYDLAGALQRITRDGRP